MMMFISARSYSGAISATVMGGYSPRDRKPGHADHSDTSMPPSASLWNAGSPACSPAGTTAPVGSSTRGVPVTDTTLAPTDSDTRSVTSTTSAPATTTQPASTSTALDWSVPPRVHHPAWDDRLPGTWLGLRATECHTTFEIKMPYTPTTWSYWLDLDGYYVGSHDEVIG